MWDQGNRSQDAATCDYLIGMRAEEVDAITTVEVANAGDCCLMCGHLARCTFFSAFDGQCSLFASEDTKVNKIRQPDAVIGFVSGNNKPQPTTVSATTTTNPSTTDVLCHGLPDSPECDAYAPDMCTHSLLHEEVQQACPIMCGTCEERLCHQAGELEVCGEMVAMCADELLGYIVRNHCPISCEHCVTSTTISSTTTTLSSTTTSATTTTETTTTRDLAKCACGAYNSVVLRTHAGTDIPVSHGVFGPTDSIPTLHNAEVVHLSPSYGCTIANENLAGKVALVQRGECSFLQKAQAAEAAGAAGLVIYNTVVSFEQDKGIRARLTTQDGIPGEPSADQYRDTVSIPVVMVNPPDMYELVLDAVNGSVSISMHCCNTHASTYFFATEICYRDDSECIIRQQTLTGCLQSQTRLDCSSAGIHTLPAVGSTFPPVPTLDLTGNRLTKVLTSDFVSVPSTVPNRRSADTVAGLKELLMPKNFIHTLEPFAEGRFPDLERLDLRSNPLVEIASGALVHLPSLKYFLVDVGVVFATGALPLHMRTSCALPSVFRPPGSAACMSTATCRDGKVLESRRVGPCPSNDDNCIEGECVESDPDDDQALAAAYNWQGPPSCEAAYNSGLCESENVFASVVQRYCPKSCGICKCASFADNEAALSVAQNSGQPRTCAGLKEEGGCEPSSPSHVTASKYCSSTCQLCRDNVPTMRYIFTPCSCDESDCAECRLDAGSGNSYSSPTCLNRITTITDEPSTTTATSTPTETREASTEPSTIAPMNVNASGSGYVEMSTVVVTTTTLPTTAAGTETTVTSHPCNSAPDNTVGLLLAFNRHGPPTCAAAKLIGFCSPESSFVDIVSKHCPTTCGICQSILDPQDLEEDYITTTTTEQPESETERDVSTTTITTTAAVATATSTNATTTAGLCNGVLDPPSCPRVASVCNNSIVGAAVKKMCPNLCGSCPPRPLCQKGFVLERHDFQPMHGDICRNAERADEWTCPQEHCVQVPDFQTPYCVNNDGSQDPCRLPNEVQSTATTTEATVTAAVDTTVANTTAQGTCLDYPMFKDSRGFSCRDWADLTCNAAPSLGYSNYETSQILHHCALSCEECSPESSALPVCPRADDSTFRDVLWQGCSSWAGSDCMQRADESRFTARQTRMLLNRCPYACGQCECNEGEDCRALPDSNGKGAVHDSCEAIHCGALCAREPGCGWSSEEDKCVTGGFTSEDEEASAGACRPREGECKWFVMQDSGKNCSCTQSGCTTCTFTDYKDQCTECGAGAYLEHGKCVSECSDGRIPMGSTDSTRVCKEPYTCESEHILGSPASPCKCDADNCFTCNINGHGSQCSRCEPGFKLYHNECIRECPPDSDLIEIDFDHQGSSEMCWPHEFCRQGGELATGAICECPAGCLECRGNMCRSCKTGWEILDGFCVLSCPAPFRSSADGTQECIPPLVANDIH